MYYSIMRVYTCGRTRRPLEEYSTMGVRLVSSNQIFPISATTTASRPWLSRHGGSLRSFLSSYTIKSKLLELSHSIPKRSFPGSWSRHQVPDFKHKPLSPKVNYHL